MFRAIIFDFNGVIVDDESLHFRAFARVFAEEGLSVSEEEYMERYLGLNDRSCLAAIFRDKTGRDPSSVQAEELFERKAQAYLNKLKEGAPLFPGAAEIIRGLQPHLPLALHSGARRHEIEAILTQHQLLDSFVLLVSADEVRVGKPAPDGYLQTLRALQQQLPSLANLQPQECLVLEDAPHGIAAAQAAGMPCLALAQSRPAHQLFSADWVRPSLADLHPQDILALSPGSS